MKLTTPTLTLTFGNDLETGHSLIQTITGAWIVKDSVSIEKTLLNGLKSSSDIVTLSLFRNCPSIEDIITTEEDIKAVLKDGNTTLFTGYVSNSFKYEVDVYGEKNLKITIESIGTRLLGKPYLDDGYFFFNCTAKRAIELACEKAGVTIAQYAFAPMYNVMKEVDSSTTCRNIIDEVCYEGGWVYFFNENGEMDFKKIDVDSLSTAYLVDSSKIIGNGTSAAVSVSKKARQYKGASVNYRATESKAGVTVFHVDGFSLPAMTSYDGSGTFTDENHTLPYIEAINALSDPSIGSSEIIDASNLKIEAKKLSAALSQYVTRVGGRWFSVYANNSSSVSQDYTSFDVTADVIYVKSVEVMKTTAGGSVLKETLSWVHDEATAKGFANLLDQYNRYCGLEYTFRTNDDIAPGRICHITEQLSGLDVYVMVTGVTYGSRGTNQIKAVGVSVFNLNAEVTQSSIVGGHGTSISPSEMTSLATTYEYMWSSSPDTIDTDSTLFKFNGKYLFVDGILIGDFYEQNWNTVIGAKTPEKPYLWCRINGGQFFRITGEDAIVYRIKSINPNTVIRNTNAVGDQVITVTAEIQNKPSTSPIWTANGDVVVTGETGTFRVPYGISASTLAVRLYDGSVADGNLVDEQIIPVRDVTNEPVYEGPTSDVMTIKSYTDGYTHTILWIGNDVSNATLPSGQTISLKKGFPMGWNGSYWVVYESINKANASSLFEMLKDGQAINTEDGVWAWFTNLVVENAAIKKLFSKEITLLDKGFIMSEGYGQTDKTGFKISASGKAEFYGVNMVNGSVSGTTFDCPTFSSMKKDGSSVAIYTGSGNNASAIGFSLRDNVLPHVVIGAFYPCSASGTELASRVAYMKWNASIEVVFYDASYGEVGSYDYVPLFGGYWMASGFKDSDAITFSAKVSSGDVFKFKNLPTYSASLEKGQVYLDGNHLAVVL